MKKFFESIKNKFNKAVTTVKAPSNPPQAMAISTQA